MLKQPFLIVLFLGFSIKTCLSIRCWNCNSDVDPNCGDPFYGGRMPLRDCDQDRTHSTYIQTNSVCRKIRQIVNNQLVTIRSCGWESDGGRRDGPCSQVSNSQYSYVEHCSVCYHDACNGANVKITNIWIPLLGTVSLLCLTRLM